MKSTKEDFIRFTKGKIHLGLNVFSGITDGYHVVHCPSVNLTTYGESKNDSDVAFKDALQIFLYDFKKLKIHERHKFLIKLGWSKETYKSKNYRQAFVNGEGELENFQVELIEESSLETVM
jgi:hypothetical protein